MFSKAADRHGAGASGADAAEGRGRNFVLGIILSAAMLAALALLLVWLNIERTKLAYRVRVLQHEVDERLDLNAKLSVERELLLSPRELGKKAELMGLGPAKTGQIRRLDGSAARVSAAQDAHDTDVQGRE
jgi:hypothetical protein